MPKAWPIRSGQIIRIPAHAALSAVRKGALPLLLASANPSKALPQSTDRQRQLAFTPHYDNHPTSAIFMPRWWLNADG
jgi:tRNA A37 threonylcarbamoyladenosine synthetase subunit TsaC/SUA5/YrdC